MTNHSEWLNVVSDEHFSYQEIKILECKKLCSDYNSKELA